MYFNCDIQLFFVSRHFFLKFNLVVTWFFLQLLFGNSISLSQLRMSILFKLVQTREATATFLVESFVGIVFSYYSFSYFVTFMTFITLPLNQK